MTSRTVDQHCANCRKYLFSLQPTDYENMGKPCYCKDCESNDVLPKSISDKIDKAVDVWAKMLSDEIDKAVLEKIKNESNR